MSDADDEQQIAEVCHRYGALVDAGAWSLLSEVFTEDAVADYLDRPRCEGLRAIRETCSASLGNYAETRHVIGDVRVRLDGDRAASTCSLLARHVRSPESAGSEDVTLAGRYLDRLVRTADGWRIEYRRLERTPT